MRVAYLETVAGVAGDMFVAALLDAGADLAAVAAAVDALHLPGVRFEAPVGESHHLKVRRFKVYGGGHGTSADDHPAPEYARPAAMLDLIGGTCLAPKIKADAMAVINVLARAESAVHGVAVEEVHFHEIGALDTIVDAVAAAAAWASLSIDEAIASPVKVGHGSVKTAHGVLPVPAPATLEILKGVPILPGEVERELATPTGAALLKHYAKTFGPMPPMTVEAVGYGGGTREIGRPNVFRVVLGSR